MLCMHLTPLETKNEKKTGKANSALLDVITGVSKPQKPGQGLLAHTQIPTQIKDTIASPVPALTPVLKLSLQLNYLTGLESIAVEDAWPPPLPLRLGLQCTIQVASKATSLEDMQMPANVTSEWGRSRLSTTPPRPMTWHMSKYNQQHTNIPTCPAEPESLSYRLKLFFVRPFLLPQVQLLGTLGPRQVLLVYNCPQPCPTAPVMPLCAAVRLGCRGC